MQSLCAERIDSIFPSWSFPKLAADGSVQPLTKKQGSAPVGLRRRRCRSGGPALTGALGAFQNIPRAEVITKSKS